VPSGISSVEEKPDDEWPLEATRAVLQRRLSLGEGAELEKERETENPPNG
jgi:hypothetical protein